MSRLIAILKISCCAVFVCAGSSRSADNELAKQAERVLKTHCYRCHGKEGTSKGGLDFILDRDKLVARKHIVAGKPEASAIFVRVQKEEMPPRKVAKRPTPAELDVLRRWIAAGAPSPSAPVANRRFLSEIDIVYLIAADLRKVPERHRKFMRYLTLANLYNAGLPEKELDVYRQAISKLVNSLSWHPRITIPKAIDKERTVFRIDLRDYQWTEETWTRILIFYPHYLPQQGRAARWIATATGTGLPYIRADWFVATASQPPLYHDILQLPLTERDLERSLRVDAVKNIREESVVRAGFNNSGIARNNRILERHDAAYGAYWRSYDFAETIEEQNIFERPLGPEPGKVRFVHSGGELIFNLPNGLQGYLIVDGNGRRLDRAPIEIVSDPKRPDKLVTNGISCMSCHVRGLHPKTDQVRAHVLKNPAAFSKEDIETVKGLYPPAEKFKKLMDEDIDRFVSALKKAGVEVEPEPVLALTLRYEGELDLALAAAELGFTPADFQARLKQSKYLARVLGAVNAGGGTVRREAFLNVLPDIVREFGLGDGLRPYPFLTGSIPEPVSPNDRPFAGHRGHILCVDFSSDGRWAASGSEDHSVRIWDVTSGREVRPIAGHREEVLAVAFSKDNRYLLTGSADRTMRMWSTASGREVQRFVGHTERVSAVAFSPDGRYAVSGSWDQAVSIWDVKTGKELHRLNGHTSYVSCVAFSPDGKYVASGGYDYAIRLWDAQSGKLVREFKGHSSEVYAVAFSPDSRRLASGGNDRTVRIWNVNTGKLWKTLTGHKHAVIRVAFSDDGQRLFSGSIQYQAGENSIRIWEANTGRMLYSFGNRSDSIWCLAFSRDGRRTLAGTSDKTLRLWELPK
ncbi:MAG: hypothetical protein KatS3mg105_4308 [Gemmatales bacterium]|nr:MAG: hypothetical protein KatS3mg105_4308 [Gemmatales bacterium]